MIISFGDRATEDLYHGRSTARARRWPPEVVTLAQRKLDFLNAATTLDDLRSPSGNRLEALRGNRRGRHSIRVNDQWRLVFRWLDGECHDVQLTDYH